MRVSKFRLAILTTIAFAVPLTTSAQSPRPSIADIRLDDGSSVRMTLLHESIDVQTKYGKLAIPVADIRRIEFGLHIPADTKIIIDRSIKRLGSAVHKERETASADLLHAGHFAAPSLRRAAKSADIEAASRAAVALAKLAERASPAMMDMNDYDTIHTVDGPIRGHVLAPGVKASSPHFGEVTLAMAGLRAIYVRPIGADINVVVDADKYHTDTWFDTGAMIEPGQRLLATADGNVDLWPQGPGQYVATPRGYNAAGPGGFMAGSLVGRIGKTGKPFFVGERHDGTVSDEGVLYLQIVASPWRNTSSGTYRVQVRIGDAK